MDLAQHFSKLYFFATSTVTIIHISTINFLTIICGKGNNGGDGFGAARWLLNYGKKVQCFGMGLSGNEALTEYNLLVDSGVEVVTMCSKADFDYCKMSISQADLVIDALLGTGFEGELKEDYAKVCDLINSAAILDVA